ncbi:MAG: hypothetical protein U5K37_03355 [Natrialbaceae archaeon]|nr:hypothetical protein [Natrialbaceae archaeon]
MWLSASRISERLASIVGVGVLLATGLYTGIDRWLISIDWLALQVDFFAGSLSTGLFSLVIVITGLLTLRGVWLDNGSEQVTEGPPVLAIVPAYRDANVLPISVESLLSSA